MSVRMNFELRYTDLTHDASTVRIQLQRRYEVSEIYWNLEMKF